MSELSIYGDEGTTDKFPVVSRQQALFRLLKAYSLYDPELGYVHGINYLAAMLLTLMEEEVSNKEFRMSHHSLN